MEAIIEFKDVISLWPTAADYARDIDVPEANAQIMRRRDSIPSKYWSATVDKAKERGFHHITLELLANIEARKNLLKKLKYQSS